MENVPAKSFEALGNGGDEMSEPRRSKGELEAEISQAVIRFKKEYMGRGPLSVRTYLIDDMVLVRLQGVLTAAEQKLVEVEERSRGRTRTSPGRSPGPR